MTEDIKYYSQFGQDKWLIENIFNNKHNGYFIDCGCANAVVNSNTLTLEQHFSWDGVGIDFMYQPSFITDRKCKYVNALVSDTSGIIKEVVKGGGTSGIHDETCNSHIRENIKTNGYYLMCTHTLTQVLDGINAPRFIDFFSLDVEGHELSVLKGLDTSKYTIDVMCIEAPYEGSGAPFKMFDDHMKNIGYDRIDVPFGSDVVYKYKG